MLDSARLTTERLETLLPKVIRNLHRQMGDDPLNELPLGQLRVMLLLFDGPATPTQIGEELALSPSAVSQTIKKLECLAMIERSDDVHDRRVRHVRLTEAGMHRVAKRYQARVLSAEPQIERLSPAERIALISIMEKLAVESLYDEPFEPEDKPRQIEL